jgi:hypothetical protein
MAGSWVVGRGNWNWVKRNPWCSCQTWRNVCYDYESPVRSLLPSSAALLRSELFLSAGTASSHYFGELSSWLIRDFMTHHRWFEKMNDLCIRSPVRSEVRSYWQLTLLAVVIGQNFLETFHRRRSDHRHWHIQSITFCSTNAIRQVEVCRTYCIDKLFIIFKEILQYGRYFENGVAKMRELRTASNQQDL